jgi:hypothetical protein
MLFLIDQDSSLNPDFTNVFKYYGHNKHKIYRVPYTEQDYSLNFLYPHVTKRFGDQGYRDEWLANFKRNLTSLQLEDMEFYSITPEKIYDQITTLLLTSHSIGDDLGLLFKNLLNKDDYSDRVYYAGCGFIVNLVIKALQINHVQYGPHYVCVGYQGHPKPEYQPWFRFFICRHVEVTSSISNTVSQELQFLGWLR